MKKILIIALCFATLACKKSSTNITPTIAAGLSGRYAVYRGSDTTYQLNSNIIQDITNETLTGDTAYLNPGTKNYIVEPNPIIGYNPYYAMADTLQFNSATAGMVYSKTGDYPFTYSLTNGLFDDGSSSPGFTTKLIAISPTVIEIETVEILNNFRFTASGSFYRKQ